MAIDVSELNGDDDFEGPITLRRPAVPTLANEGVASFTYLPDVQISADVEDASPADLKSLPEGTNLDDVIAVWSGSELKIGDQSGQGSDVLIVDGKHYRVVKLEDWSENGYWMAFAERFIP